MTVQKILTKAEAEELFNTEAFLIGSVNGIPVQTVAELLGEEASNFPKVNGSSANIYGLGGDRQYKYLYLKGFMEAVTYHNLTIYSEVLAKGEQK